MRHAEAAELELDGQRIGAWVIFIGNCRYEAGGLAPSVRVRLDDERLDARTAPRKVQLPAAGDVLPFHLPHPCRPGPRAWAYHSTAPQGCVSAGAQR
jgi:hypothetical protein